MDNHSSPWASGPKEILIHATELLNQDSDSSRRLAMIIVDNAVELMVKTFLGLPKRITGIHIARVKYQEISESFPKLLDALEEHASGKLDGINLGEIEWYHRLRNQLYHQGNGLTIEREKVTVYSELAKLLFLRLFDESLDIVESPDTEKLGNFLFKWSRFEKGITNYSELVADTFGRTPSALAAARILVEEGKMSAELFIEFHIINDIRNRVVHGEGNFQSLLTDELLTSLNRLDEWLKLQDKQYRDESQEF